MIARLQCISVAAVAAVLLAGCGGKTDPIMAQMFGMRCGDVESALCTEQPPGVGEAQPSRYCYQSLGDANCFDRPDPDRKNQELGTAGK